MMKKASKRFGGSEKVRHKGLEPPRITPSDPKSDAAANYANAA